MRQARPTAPGSPFFIHNRERDDDVDLFRHILTTQFYFEPDLIDRVHKASQPYLRRTVLPAYADAIKGDEPNNSGLRAKASFDGKVVVAQMQILLDPKAGVV